MAALLLLASVLLHAPTGEQTNVYSIKETIWTSQFGTVVLAGEETRRIGKPVSGRRSVDIFYKAEIKSKTLKKKAGERWALGELADLRQPDHGFLDDRDRLLLGGEVAQEAYPLLPAGALSGEGATWGSELPMHGIAATYRLSSVTEGTAQIAIESEGTNPQGRLRRTGYWKLEISTGRLLSWNIHSEAMHRDGSRESIDSEGQLARV